MILEGKKVIITGASSGIGKKLAYKFAEHGARITLLARREKELKTICDEINKSACHSANYYAVDLSDEKQVENLIEYHLLKDVPDILVNNAGLGEFLPIEETTLASLKMSMAVPFFCSFLLTQALLPKMLEKGVESNICFISSVPAQLPLPNMVNYSPSRSAVWSLARSLQRDLEGTSVTVSLCVFGKVQSSYFQNNPKTESQLSKSTDWFPVLSEKEAADYIFEAINKRKLLLIRPVIYKWFIGFYHLFPSISNYILGKIS